jgi:uncharacterized protein involved in exopolysaccharide biosynthesis
MSVETAAAEDLRMDVAALVGALWARALRIVIVTVLLVVVAFVVLMFVPRQYESASSLLVEDRSNSFTQAATGAAPTGSGISIDALMSSQIELIKSRDTLLAVVDSEKLRDVPEFNGTAASPLTSFLSLVGRKSEPGSVDEKVLQALNERLTVIRERDSAVISIYVRSNDPALAARIANALADEAVKRRSGQVISDTTEAIVWLQQQINQLRLKVEEADGKVADFKTQNGIFAGINGTSLPDQQISDIGRQITDAQSARNAAQSRADYIRTQISAGQPLDGIEDIRSNASIQALTQSRTTLQATLAEKLATLLPAHPTIKALNAQIQQLDGQIRAEARRVADSLDSQVTIQDGILASLNGDLTRAKLAASTQTRDGVTLDSLSREANAQRDLLNAYLLKYRDASGRTEVGSVLPDVRVITRAAPASTPAWPKTALTLGAVGIVALVLQIGSVLFGELMSGRAVYDRNDRREPTPEEVATAAPAVADVTVALDEEAAFFEAPEADAEDWSESPPEDVEAPAPVATRFSSGEMALANLNADIALGRVRVVLLAGVAQGRDAAVVADVLVAEAMHKGISVCRVDAGSMHVTAETGLTDLCADEASYGDIVHKLGEGLAEVPWGQGSMLDRRSTRPLTLIEALADIYELVVISTGRIGLGSSLPLFAGVEGRLVVVRQSDTPEAMLETALADIAALGFEIVQRITVPEPESAVA